MQHIQKIKTTSTVLDFNDRMAKKERTAMNDMGIAGNMNRVHAPEIITPHPYSLFALCKNYENFQRN